MTTTLILLFIAVALCGLIFGINVPTPTGEQTLGFAITSTDLTTADAALATGEIAKRPLGTRVRTPDGKEYVYGIFGGTVTAGNFVKIKYADTTNAPFSFIETAAATDEGVAVACASGTANKFGWFQVCGKYASANVTTAVAAGRPVCPSGTAGRAADFAGTETVTPMAIVLVTAASNAADVYIIKKI